MKSIQDKARYTVNNDNYKIQFYIDIFLNELVNKYGNK